MKSAPVLWSFLRFVRHPKIKIWWDRAATVFIRLCGPKIAARFLYQGIDWRNFDPSKPIILCLTRDFFRKDIEVLETRKKKWNYVLVEAGMTKIQQAWAPEELQIQVGYQKFQGPKYEQSRRKSETLAKELIKLVAKKQKVVAILSANIDYWQEEGFINSTKTLGLPFLALSREHAVIPQIQDAVKLDYGSNKFQYRGDAVAIAGAAFKKVLVDCLCCTDEQVWVTGFPRLDVWREISHQNYKKQWITLVTFTDGYLGDLCFRELLPWFVSAAEKFPKQKFLIKCKNFDDFHVIKSLINREIPKNLELNYEIPLSEAFPQSKLVIGYNSLALVEVLLAKTTLAIPYFSDAARPASALMFAPDEPVVEAVAQFFRSRGEFDTLIQKFSGNESVPFSEEAALAMVNHFFFVDPKKTASEYVEEFLEFHIARKYNHI